MARKARIQDTVIVQCIIDRRGIPVNLRILESLPMGLRQTTLAADVTILWHGAARPGRALG